MVAELGAAEVCRRAQLTYRRFDYLVAFGFVRCERERRGQGSPRRFRPVDLEVAAVLARMGDVGAPRSAWAAASAALYDLPRPWPRCWVVLRVGHNPRVFLEEPPTLADLGSAALVLSLPPVLAP